MGKPGKTVKNAELLRSALPAADPQLRHYLAALRAAPPGAALLLLGQAGTGRSTLARLLHARSGRPGEFVSVDCAAFPGKALADELFGAGAAVRRRGPESGALARAAGGTLFLDEIGAISHKVQARLLAALAAKAVSPGLPARPRGPVFALISTTRQDPQNLVEFGKLLPGFFRRLNGFSLMLKPLRERKRDIMPLIAQFSAGLRPVSFSKEAKDYLLSYNWPGNLRELKRFAELAAADSSRRPLTLEATQHLVLWRFF
ncbi:MAG TPA: sigma 54-interacting transcriptional regulator [Elusimicrobiales bacterium]|nr:sigma 54-interacting transcriptional regulator [Elusimicrobiales bacterium]